MILIKDRHIPSATGPPIVKSGKYDTYKGLTLDIDNGLR